MVIAVSLSRMGMPLSKFASGKTQFDIRPRYLDEYCDPEIEVDIGTTHGYSALI
jgi:hypothetical protein